MDDEILDLDVMPSQSETLGSVREGERMVLIWEGADLAQRKNYSRPDRPRVGTTSSVSYVLLECGLATPPAT